MGKQHIYSVTAVKDALDDLQNSYDVYIDTIRAGRVFGDIVITFDDYADCIVMREIDYYDAPYYTVRRYKRTPQKYLVRTGETLSQYLGRVLLGRKQ